MTEHEDPTAAPDGAIVPAPPPGELAAFDPELLPALAPPAPPPPPKAQGLAFLSIVIGGLCGGLIGWAFADLQCRGGCGQGWSAVGGIIGALVGAIGVGVIASLALRAMREWDTIQAQDRAAKERRRRARDTA